MLVFVLKCLLLALRRYVGFVLVFVVSTEMVCWFCLSFCC